MTVLPITFGLLPAFGRSDDSIDHAGAARRGRSPRRVQVIKITAAGVGDAAASPSAGRELDVQDYRDQSDEQLLEAYLAGDRPAFRELIERYRNELTHFLTRFLGSRAAADDVFQETFLQVHLSADTFDPTRRLKPWLFTIAANKARDYHRRNSRRQALSLSASMGDEGESQRYVDLLEADLPGPDEPLADAERSRLIRKVVDEMPAHLREILLLSYFQKMSYNQIADALEIPLGTVKSRLHTAVATFARAWKSARSAETTSGNEGEE